VGHQRAANPTPDQNGPQPSRHRWRSRPRPAIIAAMRGWVWAVVGVVGCTSVALTGESNCANAVRDGSETDLDCGGSCSPSPTGKGCAHAQDCSSGFCTNGKCDPPSCTDGAKNGDESDTDCGGTACSGCAKGQACKAGPD